MAVEYWRIEKKYVRNLSSRKNPLRHSHLYPSGRSVHCSLSGSQSLCPLLHSSSSGHEVNDQTGLTAGFFNHSRESSGTNDQWWVGWSAKSDWTDDGKWKFNFHSESLIKFNKFNESWSPWGKKTNQKESVLGGWALIESKPEGKIQWVVIIKAWFNQCNSQVLSERASDTSKLPGVKTTGSIEREIWVHSRS